MNDLVGFIMVYLASYLLIGSVIAIFVGNERNSWKISAFWPICIAYWISNWRKRD